MGLVVIVAALETVASMAAAAAMIAFFELPGVLPAQQLVVGRAQERWPQENPDTSRWTVEYRQIENGV
jgi:ABC-type branched-subunit amino acid transport system substrate-binding protein